MGHVGRRRTEEQKRELFEAPIPQPRQELTPLYMRPFGEETPPFESKKIDAEGMRLAGLAAKEARCVRRQVGATIYNAVGWYLASGHNGISEHRELDCREGDCPRGKFGYDEVPAYSDYTNCIAVHAEMRAILRVTPRARINGVMYVTDRPCHQCMPVLFESGLHRVVWPGGERLLR